MASYVETRTELPIFQKCVTCWRVNFWPDFSKQKKIFAKNVLLEFQNFEKFYKMCHFLADHCTLLGTRIGRREI